AIGHLSRYDEIAAGDHHDHLDEPHAHIIERRAGRHDPVGGQLGLAVAGIVPCKQLTLVLFIGKGLDHAHAADILFDPDIEITDPAIEVLPVRCHPAAIAPCTPDNERHDDQGDERKHRIDVIHQAEGADESHDGYEQVF